MAAKTMFYVSIVFLFLFVMWAIVISNPIEASAKEVFEWITQFCLPWLCFIVLLLILRRLYK